MAMRPVSLPSDPILEAIDRAPVGEPWTPQQRAELDRAMAEVREGCVELVPHEEVHAWLEARASEPSERDE